MLYECLTVTAIFGITPILEKYVLQFIEAETLILLSIFLLFILCVTYLYFFENHTKFYRDIKKMNKNWELYVLVLLIAFSIYIVANYLYLFVISKHKTYIVTSLIASYPIITVLCGYLFLGEAFTATHILGVLMIILGVVFLNM